MKSWILFLVLCCVTLAGHCGSDVLLVTLLPRSGTFSTGLSPSKMIEAVTFAVDEINAQGGLLGHKVRLEHFDSQSTALAARAAAKAAVASRPLAVIGERISSLSLVVAPILQQEKLLMITPISTHPDVTRTGDFVFRMCFLDAQQGKVMAEFSHARLHARRAVILTNVSSKYSEELSQQFALRFEQLGATVALRGEYKQDATNHLELLRQVKALHPDVLFIPGYAKDVSLVMRQARELGIEALFLGGDGWGEGVPVYAGAAANGAFSTNHWHRDDPRPISRDFVRRFEQRYGPIRSSAEVLAYDAVHTLADAVRRAKSLAPQKVRDALAATRDLARVTGTISFDAGRNPLKQVVIVRYDAGSISYVDAVQPTAAGR